MTLDAGNVLLLSVYIVSGSGRYLYPLSVTTLMAFFAGFVNNNGVLFHSLITPGDEANQQLGASKPTLQVTAMATYFFMDASSPAVPGLFHDMA